MTKQIKDEPKAIGPTLRPPPLILSGQTVKQPVVWRCRNRECLEKSTDKFFDFEADQPKCPKCTSGPPVVQKRALIHLLVRDDKGPIVGSAGVRFRIACDTHGKRSYIATPDNGEAATGNSHDRRGQAYNCPGCYAAIGGQAYVGGAMLKI